MNKLLLAGAMSALLVGGALAEDQSNLNPGITSSEILARAPIHWVSVEQIEASLEGQPPMAVGFDVDDTVLFSSACFYYGQNKYSPGSFDYLKMDAFWTDINTDCDMKYSIPKEVARKLIDMHQARGDDIYFITGRTKGCGTEGLTAAIKNDFNIKNMNDVVFTASSENKLQFLKDHNLKIYYGDADSDMEPAIQAGIRPIRVLRAPNSTYKPEPRNGRFGEEVIINSTY
jgi:acid phosphatase (class B)